MTGHHNKRGFSLIEAAIFLGVVGVVIGTIWGVSAKFYEDYNVNKTVDEVFLIASNTDRLLGCKTATAIGDNVIITDMLKDAGAVTDEMKSSRAGYIRNPISRGGMHAGAMGGNIITRTNCSFDVNLFGAISKSICYKLATRTSAIATTSRNFLFKIGNATSYGGSKRFITNLPISPTDSDSFCDGGAWDFYFSFNFTHQ